MLLMNKLHDDSSVILMLARIKSLYTLLDHLMIKLDPRYNA